jgi:hypothetical protein
MRRIRAHLTYANVVSTLCLFLLLGGGTAVALDGSNTVFSDDITNNQVYSADVRDDNLSSGGLQAIDLAPDSVRGSEIQDGSLTPADSTHVVARARGASSVNIGDGNPKRYPLSGNTWTQAANETDFFAGRVRFDAPGCTTSGHSLRVKIYVDGKAIGRHEFDGRFASSNVADMKFNGASQEFTETGVSFEPGSPDTRTLTADIQGYCNSGTIDVTSLKVNVIGFR